jgi:hypothetical protein
MTIQAGREFFWRMTITPWGISAYPCCFRRQRDMEIRVIVVVHSDPVDKSFPWCQPADELGDGLHVSCTLYLGSQMKMQEKKKRKAAVCKPNMLC